MTLGALILILLPILSILWLLTFFGWTNMSENKPAYNVIRFVDLLSVIALIILFIYFIISIVHTIYYVIIPHWNTVLF